MTNGRCYLHGGATPGGIASVHFKHGRYSRWLPAEMARRIEDACNDPELLSLKEDIACVDALISELGERLAEGEANGVHKALLRLQNHRRKLCLTEAKLQSIAKHSIPAHEAMALFAAMTEIVVEHVKDADALRAISGGLEALLGRR